MKSSRIFSQLSVAFCLSIGFAAAQEPGAGTILSKPPKIERNAPITEVPLDVRMGKLFIDATVEGETREFIFDTGTPTILTSDLANALDIEVIGQNTGTDANGREVTMDIAIVETLTLGDVTFREVPVLIFDPRRLELASCIFDGGVIGSEILPGSIWNIDTEHRRLTISAPGATTSSNEAVLKAPLYDFGYPHTPIVDYSVEDVRDKAIFDTGSAAEVAMYEGVTHSRKVRRAIADGSLVRGRGSEGVSAGGPGEIRDLTQFTLSEFLIGSENAGPVRATTRAVAPTLIGTAILERYVATLDYEAGQFILTDRTSRQPETPEPGYAVSIVDGAVTVTQLFDGSQAQQAGLRLGDHVTSINGHQFEDDDSGNVCGQVRWLTETFDRTAAAEMIVNREGRQSTIQLPAVPH